MLHISMALGDYDINRGLIDGRVMVQGCDTSVITGLASPERHWRFLRHEEFDVCELSIGSYLAALPENRFVAVPAFPHRRFRHHYYFVRADGPIHTPKDLEGRNVGLRTWQTSAGIWMRGILQHEYGVDLTKVRWFTEHEEDITGVQPPVELRRTPGNIERLLLEGGLDALFYPETLPSFAAGDQRVGRLFPDAKAAEQEYFKKTGIFPIMHVLAIRRTIAEQNPWLPRQILHAWRESKDLAMKRLENPRSVSMAWLTPLREEERAVLGPDPWQVGLTEGNRKALQAIMTYAVEQGIVAEVPEVEDLFWPSTLDALPKYVG